MEGEIEIRARKIWLLETELNWGFVQRLEFGLQFGDDGGKSGGGADGCCGVRDEVEVEVLKWNKRAHFWFSRGRKRLF